MLALAKPTTGDLLYFTFDQTFDPRELPVEARVAWIFEDYAVRRNELLLAPQSQVTALLQDRLNETRDPQELLAIIRALGFLRAVGPAVSLYPFLDHSDHQVVQESILALGRIGSRASFPRLERFLRSDEPSLKKAAVISLSKRLSRSDFRQLDAAAGSDPELQQIVRKGKRRMEAYQSKDLKALVLATLDTEEWEDLWPGMGHYGTEVLEVLADEKQSPEIRRRALGLIAITGYPNARGLVEQILRKGGELQTLAVIAAGSCRAYNCVTPLAEILKDAETGLARIVIQALGDIRSPEALSPLLSQWNVHGGALRPDLRLALRRLGRVPGRQALAEQLRVGSNWSPSALYFIDAGLQLHREYTSGLLDEELHGPGRLDALLLMAFLGDATEAPKLEALAAADADGEIRELAALGASRMRGGVR